MLDNGASRQETAKWDGDQSVAPLATPAPAGSRFLDAGELAASGLFGGYRRELGWGRVRALGARTAVGPEYPG